jgi:hypothetical protein
VRSAFTPAAATAVAAVLTAALALPAAAVSSGAIGPRDCTKPDSVAQLAGYDAFVNSASAKDTAEGYHRVARGQRLTLAIQGTLHQAVSGGKVRVVLMQPGEDQQPVASDVDLAGLFTDAQSNPIAFPAQAGPFLWYLPQDIPADGKPGHYAMALDATNQDGKPLMCFSTAFQID